MTPPHAGLLVGAVINLNHHDHYFHWGFILISLANLLVIVAMLVLFALALVVPFFPGRRHAPVRPEPAHLPPSAQPGGAPASGDVAWPGPGAPPWTFRLRRKGMELLPPAKLLPDTQPAYVSSWVYVFGVLTLSGLAVAIGSGLVLALEGPAWWHTSWVGHFLNSLHLWSVELFMGFMAIHLWGKFWMAAWRGRRALTWVTGVLAFLVSILEAFTGYLSQTNFDSQWIAFQAKDAFNATGVGGYFDVMNFGQALMLHIVFVPLVLVAVVAVHVLLVRIRGVVHPIDARRADLGEPGEPEDAGPRLFAGARASSSGEARP